MYDSKNIRYSTFQTIINHSIEIFMYLIQFQVRTSVRNCWAHCNFLQWTPTKFAASFQLLERFIKKMGVNATEENRILGDIHKWKTDGKRQLKIGRLVVIIQNI